MSKQWAEEKLQELPATTSTRIFQHACTTDFDPCMQGCRRRQTLTRHDIEASRASPERGRKAQPRNSGGSGRKLQSWRPGYNLNMRRTGAVCSRLGTSESDRPGPAGDFGLARDSDPADPGSGRCPGPRELRVRLDGPVARGNPGRVKNLSPPGRRRCHLKPTQ